MLKRPVEPIYGCFSVACERDFPFYATTFLRNGDGFVVVMSVFLKCRLPLAPDARLVMIEALEDSGKDFVPKPHKNEDKQATYNAKGYRLVVIPRVGWGGSREVRKVGDRSGPSGVRPAGRRRTNKRKHGAVFGCHVTIRTIVVEIPQMMRPPTQ